MIGKVENILAWFKKYDQNHTQPAESEKAVNGGVE
jgi:hypothetical protein